MTHDIIIKHTISGQPNDHWG